MKPQRSERTQRLEQQGETCGRLGAGSETRAQRGETCGRAGAGSETRAQHGGCGVGDRRSVQHWYSIQEPKVTLRRCNRPMSVRFPRPRQPGRPGRGDLRSGRCGVRDPRTAPAKPRTRQRWYSIQEPKVTPRRCNRPTSIRSPTPTSAGTSRREIPTLTARRRDIVR